MSVPDSIPPLFDRPLVRQRRAAAQRRATRDGAFLARHMASDICERLAAVERRFDLAVVHGSRGGVFNDALAQEPAVAARIAHLVASDVAPALAGPGGVVADDEWVPFARESLALFISIGTLHTVNDLPGALAQIRAALRPDGLFIGAFFGGETLTELRQAFAGAEAEIEGGISPRVAPFTDVRDAAGLLQRAGFALPVADRECLTVTYATPLHLFDDLRAMGETNALIERRRLPLRRRTLQRALELYAERFALPGGRIKATFEILTVTGWTPHASQQVPLRPGSARTSLKDALKSGNG